MFKITNMDGCEVPFSTHEDRFKYIYTDKDGEVYGTNYKPQLCEDDGFWMSTTEQYLGYVEYEGDWTDSLRISKEKLKDV